MAHLGPPGISAFPPPVAGGAAPALPRRRRTAGRSRPPARPHRREGAVRRYRDDVPLSLLKNPKRWKSLEISRGRPYHCGHDHDFIHLGFRAVLPPS
jgi:hypothetical protein